jgi:hypothetical protein
MGWAQEYIKKLQEGQVVFFRPRGGSMEPLIKSGALCTVVPTHGPTAAYVALGDVVLCKVGGREYLHKVLAVRQHQKISEMAGDLAAGKPNDRNEYQIGNNKGGINGWVKGTHIYGKLIKVE